MKAAFLAYAARRRGDVDFTPQELESTMRNAAPGTPALSVMSLTGGFHGRMLGSLSTTRSKAIHKVRRAVSRDYLLQDLADAGRDPAFRSTSPRSTGRPYASRSSSTHSPSTRPRTGRPRKLRSRRSRTRSSPGRPRTRSRPLSSSPSSPKAATGTPRRPTSAACAR
jgi:hypothetical protein